ncbi:MAG: phasin family protein [Anaerolineae bacterium]
MLKEQLERSVLMGIGLFSITREKAQALAEEMVKKGEMARDEVKSFTDQLVERGRQERQALREVVQEEVDTSLQDVRLVPRSEVEALSKRVEALEQRLAELTGVDESEEA